MKTKELIQHLKAFPKDHRVEFHVLKGILEECRKDGGTFVLRALYPSHWPIEQQSFCKFVQSVSD